MCFKVKNKSPHIKLLDSNSELESKRVSHILKNFDLGCVFTIYKHNPNQIHTTGINQRAQLLRIIDFIDSKCVMISWKIDNSLFSCKQSRYVNLHEILNEVNTKYRDYVPSFSEHIFNALFLKPKEKKVGNPTIILYHNSSYVILGGNCRKKIKKANSLVNNLIRNN